MTDKKADHLNPDDRIVWDIVRFTARPMRIHEAVSLGQSREDFSKLLKAQQPSIKQTKTLKLAPSVGQEPTLNVGKGVEKLSVPHLLDHKTYRKISRGQLTIDARVDLHGMTQSEAHQLLLNFVQSAVSRGLRHVLVITGKGKSYGSDGILKQAVPHWFSTAPFRLFVSGYEDAAKNHGGDGALYLKLRRGRLL